jgi:hypothetical protein
MSLSQDPEQLENLPSREVIRVSDTYDHYWGEGMPWARMNRWFEAQEGRNVDRVFHDFVHLKWLLAEYRTKEQFRRHIEMDTFVVDGRVCYYDAYHSRWQNEPWQVVEKQARKTIYVNPTTHTVEIFKPPTDKSWKSRWYAERAAKVKVLGDYHQLYKKDGIWYEVKAQKATNRMLHFTPWRCPLKKPDDILMESGDSPLGQPIQIILKRQLNSKELRKHGLANDLK